MLFVIVSCHINFFYGRLEKFSLLNDFGIIVFGLLVNYFTEFFPIRY